MFSASMEDGLHAREMDLILSHQNKGSILKENAKVFEETKQPRYFSCNKCQLTVFSFCAGAQYGSLFLRTPRNWAITKINAVTTSAPAISRTASIIGIRVSFKMKWSRLKQKSMIKSAFNVSKNSFDRNPMGGAWLMQKNDRLD